MKASDLLQYREFRLERVTPVLSAVAMLFFLACAGPAHSADVSVPMTLPAPTAATLEDFDWTGFHIGIHGGFGVDHFAFKYAVASPAAAFSGTDGITGVGPIGGVQAGFTYRFPFKLIVPYDFVAGLEFDMSWSGIGGQTDATRPAPPGLGTATFGSRFLNFGTARLRLGFAWGRFFPYITGGFTYGIVETYGNAATNGGFSVAGSTTVVRSGIIPQVGNVGIGVEYAMAPNWTVKAEYLYEFIDARWASFQSGSGTTQGFGTRTMYHIGRVGLNYRFDWPHPVAVSK